ncbi:MAG TPA: histidine kinase [Vicinamibacterales bacterium]|nr:histidine kinase [Vicinamibacterales bacterium]
MNGTGGRLRLWSPWWLYAAAWIPFAGFYSLALKMTNTLPLGRALVAGSLYAIPPALFGVAIWRLSGVLVRRRARVVTTVVVHVLGAAFSTSVWLFIEIGQIALQAGWDAAIAASHAFAGFQLLDGMFVYGVLAVGSHVIRIAGRLREEEARAARADALRMRAELAALRGQLNPHFLFNTLHTLTALVTREPAAAEHALERFGDMLRYVLDVKRAAREDVTLAEEMRFVRDYLSLEQLRLGDRLRVVERIDPEALDCIVPSLTLQPLVENAIKHAIAPRVQGGTIEIHAALDADSLVLEVRDDGPGAAPAGVDAAKGMGLRAVRQRLETRYPNEASFTVTTAPREGFVVRAMIPAHVATALPPTTEAVAAPAAT